MNGAETELAIDHDGARLRGTLCLPGAGSEVPVVIMVHGSGPLDRDTNMPGQRLDVFKTISRTLADIGVASLRYDKRGCAASTGDFLRAGHSHHVQDVVAWVDRMAAEPGIGGYLRMGMMRLLGGHVDAQRKLIARIRSSSGDTLRAGLKRMPARWLRELLDIEPRALFAQVTCPVLVIGGGKDLQCEAGDVEELGRLLGGDSEIHLVADLSHVLRLEKGTPTFARYPELIGEPMAPVVLDLISDWLRRISRSPPAAH